MRRTLRVRMVLILTLLTVSVMLVVGSFFLGSFSNYYHQDFKNQMQQLFHNDDFTLALEDVQPSQGTQGIYDVLTAYAGQLGIDAYRNFYILNGTDGTLLGGSKEEDTQVLERTPNLIAALNGKTGEEVSKVASYLDYAQPISLSDGTEYIIYIKDTKQELQDMIWMLFAIILQALLVGLVIAVIMSFFLAKAITNPVEKITKGAKLMEAGDFSHQIPVISKDEIGVLTQTFNQMAETLKNSMDEIEEEKNKLATIFLYLTDGVVAFTKEGQMMHMNSAAHQMLGVAEGAEFTYEGMQRAYGIELDFGEILALPKGENRVIEVPVGERTLKMCFAHFDVESATFVGGGAVVVLQDITEQHRFEVSRKEFVANVSHELRTPLTSVKSYTETVLENPDLPVEMKEKFLKVVLYETDRMTRLVKDLLILSRLDNKRMEWAFTTFDLRQLMNNIYDSTLMDARSHNHSLTLDVEDGLYDICGDKDRIEQVILNVVSNAIKYTPDGGRIRINAKNQGENVSIQVEDNGIGIPEKDIPRLFERFYRVDKARSRKMGGTGLGLAIAKEIILAHHGDIRVESQQDLGTKVTITLPREQKKD